jgi:hypothetical protein
MGMGIGIGVDPPASGRGMGMGMGVGVGPGMGVGPGVGPGMTVGADASIDPPEPGIPRGNSSRPQPASDSPAAAATSGANSCNLGTP